VSGVSTGLDFDEATARSLEIMYRTPDVVGQRSRVLAALALCPGERVLDVGVGPGLLAQDMALTVGQQGRVAGIDASEAMIATATRRCAEQEVCELRVADATKLPFDDGAFDAVVSTQVYEYVAQIDLALAEAARVLRPGGRLFVLDTDWDTAIWHSSDRTRMQRVLSAWEEHLHDPWLPRTLGRRLEEAGLVVHYREVIPIVNPALHRNCYSFGIMAAIAAFVGGRRGVDAEEASAWVSDLRELGERGEYFFSINRYLFGAIKLGASADASRGSA
jgi:ubiquinone/menaquinone biosynthesis C-methylase UbiE